MNDMEIGKNNIIEKIHENAAEEGKKIIREVDEECLELQKITEKKIENIKKEIQTRIELQKEQLNKKNRLKIDLEKSKIKIYNENKMRNHVFIELGKYLENLYTGKDYREMIINWIIEAGLGLNKERAIVNGGKNEIKLIDDNLLKEAERLYKKTGNKDIEFIKSKDAPLNENGIMLYSEDGKMAYNNLLSTLILRKEAILNKLIFDEIVSLY